MPKPKLARAPTKDVMAEAAPLAISIVSVKKFPPCFENIFTSPVPPPVTAIFKRAMPAIKVIKRHIFLEEIEKEDMAIIIPKANQMICNTLLNAWKKIMAILNIPAKTPNKNGDRKNTTAKALSK